MNREDLSVDANKILKQRNLAIMISGILLLSNFLLTTTFFLSSREIVLVPNSLNSETSIRNGKMSPAYLEAITRDVVNLMLNVTPSNAEYSAKSILKIVHPIFYGKLKQELNERNKDIIKRRISTLFFPQAVAVNEGQDGVIVTGKLSTYLGKEEVLNEDKIYSITYSIDGFQPLVMSFYEVQQEKSENNKGAE